MHKMKFAGYNIYIPGHPLLRIVLGVILCILGLLGFLPILGFWMIPLGLAVLSVDIPMIRRWRRRFTVKFGCWLHRRWPQHAEKFGFGVPRARHL